MGKMRYELRFQCVPYRAHDGDSFKLRDKLIDLNIHGGFCRCGSFCVIMEAGAHAIGCRTKTGRAPASVSAIRVAEG